MGLLVPGQAGTAPCTLRVWPDHPSQLLLPSGLTAPWGCQSWGTDQLLCAPPPPRQSAVRPCTHPPPPDCSSAQQGGPLRSLAASRWRGWPGSMMPSRPALGLDLVGLRKVFSPGPPVGRVPQPGRQAVLGVSPGPSCGHPDACWTQIRGAHAASP